MSERDDEEDVYWNCGEAAGETDKFCRHCGTMHPARVITWDWREQPDWLLINAKLEEFGCIIVEVNTKDDRHAVRIERRNNKQ